MSARLQILEECAGHLDSVLRDMNGRSERHTTQVVPKEWLIGLSKARGLVSALKDDEEIIAPRKPGKGDL